MPQQNKVYYNINIPWNEDMPCDACSASVQFDSGETVLDKGSDYYLSIQNFSLPISSIPIFFVDIEKFPNVDVNKTVYEIALEHLGVTVTESVIFEPNDFLYSPPPPPTAQHPEVPRSFYYTIYTYTRFVDLINKAYVTAHTTLGAPGNPPKLHFNPNNNLFSLIVDEAFYESTLANPVMVYMGYKLYQFFVGFNVTRLAFQSVDARDFRFNVVVNENVSAGVITVQQDYSTTSNWNTLRSLQLRGPMLQVADEYVPSIGAGSDGRSAKASILASFNPIYDNSPGSSVARSQISFTLQSANRLIDIVTTNPLTKISLAVFWTDERNNEHRLVLNYRELIQVKICFHLKSSYAG